MAATPDTPTVFDQLVQTRREDARNVERARRRRQRHVARHGSAGRRHAGHHRLHRPRTAEHRDQPCARSTSPAPAGTRRCASCWRRAATSGCATRRSSLADQPAGVRMMRHAASPSRAAARPQRGVMLIEALVAIAIFSFAILGIMGLQATAIRAVRDADYRAKASLFANQIVGRMWVDRFNVPTYALNADGDAPCTAGTNASGQPGGDQLAQRPVRRGQPGLAARRRATCSSRSSWAEQHRHPDAVLARRRRTRRRTTSRSRRRSRAETMRNTFSTPSASAGFSLVEILVGMVVGLVVTIIIYQVVATNEGVKRTTTRRCRRAAERHVQPVDHRARHSRRGLGHADGRRHALRALLHLLQRRHDQRPGAQLLRRAGAHHRRRHRGRRLRQHHGAVGQFGARQRARRACCRT